MYQLDIMAPSTKPNKRGKRSPHKSWYAKKPHNSSDISVSPNNKASHSKSHDSFETTPLKIGDSRTFSEYLDSLYSLGRSDAPEIVCWIKGNSRSDKIIRPEQPMPIDGNPISDIAI